jgi:uncharacterized OB-fold protein
MGSPGDEASLRLAHCERCGGYGYPATVHGCGRCGAPADALRAVPCPRAPRLLNFTTVHAELAPGLPVPCVIGEVELVPGVVEEALIDADAASLQPGLPLTAHAADGGWRFKPAAAQEGR